LTSALSGAGLTSDVLGLPAGHPGLRRRVGYATQAPATYLDLSVRGNLEYFAVVTGAVPGRVEKVLSQVRLGGHSRLLV